MKIICITGWVLSGIGKGITWASIGAILKSAGYNIFMQKFDGYLNIDPGTMNPLEHGEVFVTDDGTETDLDIGHYERFIDTNLTKDSSWTTGKIYQEIFEKERKGEYLWQTVQVVSHVAWLVKEKIKQWYEHSGADISLIEIWGTVGDMENEYLIESLRQLRHELGSENVIFIHLVYLPYLWASKELKTKPAQNSVRDLMARGIDPDLLVLRADMPIDDHIIKKLSIMCWLPEQCVIPSTTVSSIYEVPVNYHHYGVGERIIEKLKLPNSKFDLSAWNTLLEYKQESTTTKKIAMVWKYCKLEDAYYSLNEWLKTAGYWNKTFIHIDFIDATDIEIEGTQLLESYDGICIPWGFGTRGIEGMILTTQYAREHNIPFLWICLGSQIMAIEYARNVLWYSDATSEEFDTANQSTNHIVHIMNHQKTISDKWWTMRLGSYECILTPWSKAEQMYSNNTIQERHRHRYEFNNNYREEFEKNWFHISGTSSDGLLVEIVELSNHPYMIATQAHPELKSRPLNPHPLFIGFVHAL